MNAVFKSLVVVALTFSWVSSSVADVLTQHNDSSRTGQNLQETTLNTTNVNVTDFGKLFSVPVSGNIFAQPLYVSNLTIGSQGHVLYVATAANNVYAIDGDTGNILWTVGPSILGTPVPSQDICVTDEVECPYTDTIPVIGIISTPVIDSSGQTLYLVANSKDGSGNYHFKLHALSLINGGEKFGGPTEITTSGIRQLTEMCRPGLLLANGMVYLAMGSVGDFPSWHGYVMAYDASTLQQVAVYNSTPQNNGQGGAGVWQSGNGLVADSNGDVYPVASNGNFDVNTGGEDYGSAYLKLNGSTLSVLDYFVPYNQASLNPETDNVDLGSGGPLLIPNTTLLVGTGKDAVLRVVNTSNMGKYNPTTNQNLQNIVGATNAPVLSSPVYWDSPTLGQVIYLWGLNDFLKAWAFNGKDLNAAPVSQSAVKGAPSDAAALSISADGSTSGTGVLWATRPISGTSNPGPTAGIVYAFDASNLGHELWDSQQNSARDALGNWAKFNPPTIANGKVYVATFSGQLVVYGLNPASSSQVSFVQVNSGTPQSSTSSVTVAFPSAQTQGNLNIVVIGWNDTTTTVQSITDSLGNTYTLAVGPTKGTSLTQSIYYAKDILGGSNSVTVTFSAPAEFPDVRILEYTGADTTSPLDVSASALGNSASANSGSATTKLANELIFGADTVATGNAAAGTNFTPRIITPHDSDLAEDRSVTTTGTYSATATLTSSGAWIMQMATFKASGSSGGGSAPTITSVSPNSGSTGGGTAVTITGTNFISGTTVTFGGTAGTKVTIVSSTSITATTPAHAAGTVNVVVSNTNGSNTLTNGFTYTSSTITISIAQKANSATPQSPTTTVSVPYLQAQTAGDLNLIVVGWNDTTATVVSVKDNLGNSYSLVAGPFKGTRITQAIYLAKNILAGSNTVTVTFSQAATFPDIRILEYKGLSTTAPVDVTAGASGTSSGSATVSSGSATTNAATELIFGAGTTNGGFTKAGSSFTSEIITPDGDIAEDDVVSSSGSYSATAGLGAYGSQNWVMQMLSLKQ